MAQESIASAVVRRLSELLQRQERCTDQEEDQPHIQTEEAHDRVEPVEHIVQHCFFCVAVAAAVIQADRQHLLQHVVWVYILPILHQQHVGIFGKRLRHLVRHDHCAAVVVADLGHPIGFLKHSIRRRLQRFAADRKRPLLVERCLHILQRALIIAIQQIFIVCKSDRRSPLHRQRAVEI